MTEQPFVNLTCICPGPCVIPGHDERLAETTEELAEKVRDTLKRAPSTAGGWRLGEEGIAALDSILARLDAAERSAAKWKLRAQQAEEPTW